MSDPKYIFGPIPSRRLGRSLGVDVIPRKLCTLDCVYCEVGKTSMRAMLRKEYEPAEEILAELRDVLSEYPPVDVVTFSGSGEPTLNSALGSIIRGVKQMTKIPVAVITNGTLLYFDEVRNNLLDADIVLPTLNTVTQEVFERLSRPHPKLRIQTIIRGLKAFRKEYSGQLWLEVMVVKGVNDGDEEIGNLKKAIEEIQPDKIQLNTVVRPPTENWSKPASDDQLAHIQELLGPLCEVIGTYNSQQELAIENGDLKAILSMLDRRPMTIEHIAQALGVPHQVIAESLATLEERFLVNSFFFQKRKYYRAMVFGSRARCG